MKLKNHQISLIIIIIIIPLSKSSINNCISINSIQNSTSNSIKNNILYITNNISQSDCFSQSLSSSLKCCYKETKFEYENNKTSSNFNKIISTQGTCYPFYDFNNISYNKENYYNQLKAFYKEFKFFAENITKSIYYYGNVNYLNEIIECPNDNEFLFNISNINYSENELKIINSGSTCFDYSLNLNNSLEISQEICNKSNILKDSIEAGNECCFIHTGEYHHTQIYTKCFYGKVAVICAFICRTEYLYQKMRKQFYNQKCSSSDTSLCCEQPCEQLTNTFFKTRTHIETYYRNTACRHSYNNGNDYLKEFHNDTNDSHRYLCILFKTENSVHCPIFTNHIVNCSHCRNK